jgi:acetyl esterase
MYARIGLSFLVLAFAANFMSLAAQSLPLHFPRWELKRDIEYSRVNGVSLRLDASFPAAGERVPAVILVHGGGWISGDRRIDVGPLFKPLREAGFAWFSISYRFATDILHFGVAIEDVESAIRFVKTHASEFNIDARRIALIGESAGGQLAAMAALRQRFGCSVKAVVALYAPTDLVYLLKNSQYVPEAIKDSVEGKPWERLVLAGLARLSPMDNVRPDMPPFLFIHGTADPLVPFAQSRDMCDRMRKAGASCEIYPVQGAGHGIRSWESHPRLASGYKHKLVQWLNEQMCSPMSAKS